MRYVDFDDFCRKAFEFDEDTIFLSYGHPSLNKFEYPPLIPDIQLVGECYTCPPPEDGRHPNDVTSIALFVDADGISREKRMFGDGRLVVFEIPYATTEQMREYNIRRGAFDCAKDFIPVGNKEVAVSRSVIFRNMDTSKREREFLREFDRAVKDFATKIKPFIEAKAAAFPSFVKNNKGALLSGFEASKRREKYSHKVRISEKRLRQSVKNGHINCFRRSKIVFTTEMQWFEDFSASQKLYPRIFG